MQARLNEMPLIEAQLQKNWRTAYANYLQELLEDPNIAVGKGQHRSKLYMPEALCNRLNFIDREADGIGPFIKYKNKFEIMQRMQLAAFKEQITLFPLETELEEKKVTPILRSLKTLLDDLQQVKWNKNNCFQYICITDHFIQQIKALKNPLTLEEITQSANALDQKLFGKPPLNPYIKAAICGVIGALVGLVIGVIIGGASTFYAGGFGALPVALATAFKGAALGQTVAAVGLASVLGSLFGLFSGKKQGPKYLEKMADTKHKMQNIYDDSQEVFDSLRPKP
ncbi:MAG: hypothetical protein P4M14_05190 [Gammaproteobacteria bacterium]|nr:hypothetical protein [Gammaproteobacteria bacterium]